MLRSAFTGALGPWSPARSRQADADGPPGSGARYPPYLRYSGRWCPQLRQTSPLNQDRFLWPEMTGN